MSSLVVFLRMKFCKTKYPVAGTILDSFFSRAYFEDDASVNNEENFKSHSDGIFKLNQSRLRISMSKIGGLGEG